MIIAIDCETTGKDLYFGSRPFFVTTCNDQGDQQFWEWPVDPLTRNPVIPTEDAREICNVINEASAIVGQNIKFDVTALQAVLPPFQWPWEKTIDTLIAAHMLNSAMPHDLTSLAAHYLGVDIAKYEDKLAESVKKARQTVRSKAFIAAHGQWRIAKDGEEDMPSVKKGGSGADDKNWKSDYWLPRAVAKIMWETGKAGQRWKQLEPTFTSKPANIFRLMGNRDKAIKECSILPGWEWRPPTITHSEKTLGEYVGHPWWTVLAEYANADSGVTLPVWKVMEREIARRKLGKIFYGVRMKLPAVAYQMEVDGLTVNETELNRLTEEYKADSAAQAVECQKIAAKYKYELELPKGGSVNNSLRGFAFDILKLPPVRNPKAKTDAPTLDSKNAIPLYLDTLPQGSDQLKFIQALVAKRSRDTACSYMEGYKRYWQPLVKAMGGDGASEIIPGWFVLHPSLNPTGTGTLRWSSQHPNEQNISKKESFNLRRCFGPAPGEEWWSMDAKNIELRLPAYESGEQELIALFERPDDAPYYGSNHLLVFHLLWPKLWDDAVKKVGWDKAGPYCKKTYADTYYGWVKNGNFAVQYGAVEKLDGSGTADRAYHQKGAHALVKAKFSKLEALNRKCIDHANRFGYVETMPDKSVDPDRGYPLVCTRASYGKVLETVPLNYHVQGSAMWWMGQAMIRCNEQLKEWQADGFPARLVMQVHDELVFAFPKKADPKVFPRKSNLARVRVLKTMMERGGHDVGVPTPVSCEFHPESYAVGISV